MTAKLNKRFFSMTDSKATLDDWLTPSIAPNQSIEAKLTQMRNKARDLYWNDDYAKRFVSLAKTHVLGHKGIRLQAKAEDAPGKLDKRGNEIIELAWAKWGRKGHCDVTTRLSMRTLAELSLKSLIVDGEFLLRIIQRGTQFKVQVIDPMALDPNLNRHHPGNGNAIHGSIEYDVWNAPIAYYFLTRNPVDPSEAYFPQPDGRKYIRVPAGDIIHEFVPEVVNQRRGVPWFATPGTRMYLLQQFEDVALTNARVGASKQGFFTQSQQSEAYTGDEFAGRAEVPVESTPGGIDLLPAGVDFREWNPDFPSQSMEPFMKAVLRGIASGLGVSYHSLGNNLEGVNYSSARVGELTDREIWKGLQEFMIESLYTRLYERWLENAMVTLEVPLPVSKIEKFLDVQWIGRRWAWVDPQKEVGAYETAVNLGLISRRRLILEQGHDPDEVWAELKEEEKLFPKPDPTQFNYKGKTSDEDKKSSDNGGTDK